MIANVSRAALPDARRIFRGLRVLALTARPEVLAARLAARGRETAEDIAERLARAGEFTVRAGCRGDRQQRDARRDGGRGAGGALAGQGVAVESWK